MPPTPIIKLSDCWAKTDPKTGMPALTVSDHCQIVGHVASVLLENLPTAVKANLPKGAIALAAAHDLGKLTPGFQLKCNQWQHHQALSAAIYHDGLETRHARVSAWHLAHATSKPMQNPALKWLVSTAGHHGSYPSGFEKPSRKCLEGAEPSGIHPQFEQLRDDLLTSLIQTFGQLPDEPAKEQEIRTHLLTGFTILADWIGSNPAWFPPAAEFSPAAIKQKTREILLQFGMPLQIRKQLGFGQLFSPAAPDAFTANPLQQALLTAADTPGLYIVEAPMGAGKTEAALAAAYQRWTTGNERGLYFALPTQLTSVKIHDRIHSFLASILDSPAYQSLIHGNAWLDEHRNRSVGPPTEENDDTDEALQWFSTTRRQLLAPFGTGTIDQALLAILPARFAALRFFALAGKVVVIDEVHSYDPYMSALIDRLIEFLLPTGATVIILSATLTAARRSALVAAAGASESAAPDIYPLITKVAAGDSNASHIEVIEPVREKTVEIQQLTLSPENDTAYWQSIADRVVAGANVLVIRNTVALAQQTFLHLKSLLNDSIPPKHCGLLHSRFTHTRRLCSEGKWISKLGKNPAKRPAGSLLVATQIVEQSVDIDADLLITDLAPVELILQRIGRLHRHKHKRPVGCETPSCHILLPAADWQASVKEIEVALAPHHYIYPPLALWQSMEILGNRRSISIPCEIRPLLESAVAANPDPATLRAFDHFLPDAQRKLLEQKGTAKARHVFAQSVDDKQGTETRWRIQPTAHLILLREHPTNGGGSITIRPVHGALVSCPESGVFSPSLARALHKNAIRIPAYLIRPAFKDSPDWLRLHIPDAVIAVVKSDSATLDLPFSPPLNHSFEYTKDLGITWRKNENTTLPASDPEDFWY